MSFYITQPLLPVKYCFVSPINLIYCGERAYNGRLSALFLACNLSEFWLDSLQCMSSLLQHIVCFILWVRYFASFVHYDKGLYSFHAPSVLTFRGKSLLLGWLNQTPSHFWVIMGQFSTSYQVISQPSKLFSLEIKSVQTGKVFLFLQAVVLWSKHSFQEKTCLHNTHIGFYMNKLQIHFYCFLFQNHHTVV